MFNNKKLDERQIARLKELVSQSEAEAYLKIDGMIERGDLLLPPSPEEVKEITKLMQA